MKKAISLFLMFIVAFFMLIGAYAPALIRTNAAGASLTTTLTDGAIQRGSKKTFDVWARNAEGEKIPSRVTLNGEDIKANWDDTDKTSYTLHFSKQGTNTVAVFAGDASKNYTLTYKKASNGDVIGKAAWSIELFTIGCGYLVEPFQFDIIEGENAADALLRIVRENGYIAYYGGSTDAAFYLAYIADGNKTEKTYNSYTSSSAPGNPRKLNLSPSVPEVLYPHLEKTMSFFDDKDYSENWQGYIGEFVISNGSGWMYSVNNVFPNVGFSDCYLSDGDVVRVQFTLAYGADIGGTSALGAGEDLPDSSFFNIANKDRLTDSLSRVRNEDRKSGSSVYSAYASAKNTAMILDASQSTVDNACEALNKSMLPAATVTKPTEALQTTVSNTVMATESVHVSNSEYGGLSEFTQEKSAAVSDSASSQTQYSPSQQTAPNDRKKSVFVIIVAALGIITAGIAAILLNTRKRKKEV